MAEASLSTMPLYVKAGSIIPYYMSVEKNINTDIPLEFMCLQVKMLFLIYMKMMVKL